MVWVRKIWNTKIFSAAKSATNESTFWSYLAVKYDQNVVSFVTLWPAGNIFVLHIFPTQTSSCLMITYSIRFGVWEFVRRQFPRAKWLRRILGRWSFGRKTEGEEKGARHGHASHQRQPWRLRCQTFPTGWQPEDPLRFRRIRLFSRLQKVVYHLLIWFRPIFRFLLCQIVFIFMRLLSLQ